MAVETLGQAWDAGWVGHMRCTHVHQTGPDISHHCGFRHDLDMTTLVIAKGGRGHLSNLALRMMCPLCRTVPVALVFTPPSGPTSGALQPWQPPKPDATKRGKLFGGAFTVDVFDRRTGALVEQLATAERFEIALSAWDAACRAMPARWLICRQWGGRILAIATSTPSRTGRREPEA